jgi:hypothetical protein
MGDSGHTFDPSWIVNLFDKKLNHDCPEAMHVLESLRQSTHPVCYCSCGCGDPYFIDPKSSDWKFLTNLTAYDSENQTLVILDIMEDWSVGSIELQRDMPCDFNDMVQVEME